MIGSEGKGVLGQGGDLHVASLRRQISMNCLISCTSRGMLGEDVDKRMCGSKWTQLIFRGLMFVV